MSCPHCLMDSRPRGAHMKDEVFDQVLGFCREASPMMVCVSGGEPTEHPEWERMVKELLAIPGVHTLALLTNGQWIEDPKTRIAMAKLIRSSKGRMKVQVYSHPDYYKDHEWTAEHEAQFRSIGCWPDFHSPIFMQDLGRARKNCQDEVRDSDHVPSCVNSHMIAVQTHSMQAFLAAAAQAGKFCRPLIDINGDVHMSESWLCQKVANISDGVDEVFRKMRASRPCKGCRLYSNFERLHEKEMQLLETGAVYNK